MICALRTSQDRKCPSDPRTERPAPPPAVIGQKVLQGRDKPSLEGQTACSDCLSSLGGDKHTSSKEQPQVPEQERQAAALRALASLRPERVS